MNQPSNFLGGPSYHPQPTPITQTYEPRAPYAPRAVACLTVRQDGRVFLNKEAVRLLGDAVGAVELQLPVRQRDRWRLSCQAGARCPLHSVAGTGGRWFSAPVPAKAILEAVSPIATSTQLLLHPVGNGLYTLHKLTCNN